MKKLIPLFAAFVATVYGANWAIAEFGMWNIGFGLKAPAGVFFAGVAFGLRDLLHDAAGRAWRVWVLSGIALGAVMSWLLADAVVDDGFVVATARDVAVASACAFTLSEVLDLLIYQNLRDRNWPIAAAVSNAAGAVLDSIVFLWLAFGSLDFLRGQVLAKWYTVGPAVLALWWFRSTQRRTITITRPYPAPYLDSVGHP